MSNESAPKGAHEIPAKASTETLRLPEITPLARELIGRVPHGGEIPRYGSTTWNMLADQDPRRAAAIMRAAEAWRRHCSPAQVAADLQQEMAAHDDDLARRLRETSWDVHAALYPHLWDITTPHHRTGLPLPVSPSFAELCERRGEPEKAERARTRGVA